MIRPFARVAATFRVDLPRPVLLLQAGSAINSFGYGLVLPFEIIYLHHIRGFAITTAGLVLSTVMVTAAVSGPAIGALLDHIRAKPVLIGGSLASALGYGGLAFVDRPLQAFLCSVAAGIGYSAAITAGPTLTMLLLTPEQRGSAFALSRVALNLGIGGGALAAGLIVASNGHLQSFQALYLLDTASYVGYALVVLFAVPNAQASGSTAGEARTAGFRGVAKDKTFVALLAANVVLTIVGYSLFGNLIAPFARAHTAVGTRAIGVLFLVNTAFIVIAQLPAGRLAERLPRTYVLAGLCGIWALACLGVLPATVLGSPLAALALIGVAIAFAVGECFHAVVLGPVVVDLAPPHQLGRYMSLYGLTLTLGLGLGPAAGAALLAASPDAVWLVGAAAATVVGFGLLLLGGRIPDPLTRKRAAVDTSGKSSRPVPSAALAGTLCPEDLAAQCDCA